MDGTRPGWTEVVVKTLVTHTLTYFIMGLLAFVTIDYTRLFAETGLKYLMRQTNDPFIVAGPLLQPIRGALFGIVFYMLGEVLFGRRRGWLVLWTLLVVVGIFGTFGPSPGSLEGMIYTVLPLWVHLKGLPEVILQALLLSVVLFYWIKNRDKKWLNWVMGVSFCVAMLLPALGMLAQQQK